MSDITAGQTIPGQYALAKTIMPDGSEVETFVEQILFPDGTKRWVAVDERIKAFEDRFDDTETIPANLPPVTTDAIVKDATTISNGTPTQRNISAQLVRAIGDPDRILENGKIDDDKLAHLKRNMGEVSLLRGMCHVAGGKWMKVMSKLPATGF